jgi:mRNA interferase RelE/StbE
MFKIEAKRRVLRALEKLDRERKDRVREVLIALRMDPVPFRRFDVAKLRGYENFYRIRIGDLRIIYEVKWRDRKILIHFIGARERAYERF